MPGLPLSDADRADKMSRMEGQQKDKCKGETEPIRSQETGGTVIQFVSKQDKDWDY